jgi:uncharacterized protein YdaU (DUF1376 family)
MAELPFFPLSTDAFLADCVHLDDAETGRYFLLLVALWRAPQQRLPNNDEWLSRKFRREVERVKMELRPLIAEFCQSDGNWITQRRISKEYKRAVKAINQRRDAANARWLKEKMANERTAASYGSRNAPTLIPTPILESSSSEISTDPARDASLTPRGYATRAMPTVKERVEALAAANRRKMLGTT